jgi:hypothetical protein
MKAFLLSILIIASGTVNLFAQNETQWLPDQPGKWSYNHKIQDEIKKYNIKTSELSKYKQNIDSVMGVPYEKPLLMKNSVGYNPSVNSKIRLGCHLGYSMHSLAIEFDRTRIAIEFCQIAYL